MQIGILQTGKINMRIRDQFGNYPDMFQDLLNDKHYPAEQASVQFTVFDVTEGVLPDRPEACDVYIITGSSAGVYEEHSWLNPLFDFLRQCAEMQIKLVGICFGHQAIAKALGGEVVKFSGGWGVGNRMSALTDIPALNAATGRQITQTQITLPYFHQDQVISLPEDAQLTVADDFCAIAGFVICKHVLCFQGHPEFNADYLKALIEVRRESLGEDNTQHALSTVNGGNDRHLVGQWIADFCVNNQPNGN